MTPEPTANGSTRHSGSTVWARCRPISDNGDRTKSTDLGIVTVAYAALAPAVRQADLAVDAGHRAAGRGHVLSQSSATSRSEGSFDGFHGGPGGAVGGGVCAGGRPGGRGPAQFRGRSFRRSARPSAHSPVTPPGGTDLPATWRGSRSAPGWRGDDHPRGLRHRVHRGRPRIPGVSIRRRPPVASGGEIRRGHQRCKADPGRLDGVAAGLVVAGFHVLARSSPLGSYRTHHRSSAA